MPTPRMSKALMREAIETMEACFKDGFAPPGMHGQSAIEEASRRLNLPRNTLVTRLIRAKRENMVPDPKLWVDPNYREVEALHATPKPRIRVRATTNETPPEGPSYKIVAIGDPHDRPGRDKERFRWMGRYIAEHQPDYVICIGDWASLDSLSTFDKPGSANDISKPSFPQDLDSLEESLSLFHSEFEFGSIPCILTEGNHEYRAQRAADADPKRMGDAMERVRQPFAQFRWKTLPYGEWFFLGGVGFTHVPHNAMGKDYRGKAPENQIGNDAVFSIVMGHTHKYQFRSFPKIGPCQRIEVMNLGTSLPWGVVEDYAGLSTTGWSYGIVEMTIQSGRIVSHAHVSMLDLQERYA